MLKKELIFLGVAWPFLIITGSVRMFSFNVLQLKSGKTVINLALKRRLTVETLITLITFAVLGVGWYLIAKSKLISDIFIPAPAKVWQSFCEILTEGYKGNTLLKHLTDSMGIAFLLAVITGIPLGLVCGYSSKLRAVFDPLVEFYRPLPPLAYYTILIVWLGIEDLSKITLLFLATLAPIYVAAMSGVKSIRADLINGAYTLGANRRQVFWHVILPACLPYIFTGLRTAMGAGYSTLVAAEMVAAVTGIGWMVLDASRFLRTDIIYMGIIVMGITGIILDKVLRFCESKVVPWKGLD